MKLCRNFANVFRTWKTIWKFAELVAKSCEFSVENLPRPKKLLINIEFIFSIHSLGPARMHAVLLDDSTNEEGQEFLLEEFPPGFLVLAGRTRRSGMIVGR